MKELEKVTKKNELSINLQKFEVTKFEELNAISGGRGAGVSESEISE